MTNRTSFTHVSCALLFATAGLLTAETTAIGQDETAIAKDSVQISAFTFSSYRKNYDIWSWAPIARFRVNGPIASGSQLYVEFNVPGSGPWVKFDCKTGDVQKGHWWKTECGGRDVPEEKGGTYTGAINFSIRMRNELTGSDKTLFTGRIKVAKVHSNEHGPKVVNHFVYYVDDDWNLPIGYVFLVPASDSSQWDRPHFKAAFWVRGEAVQFSPHLFYKGEEVGLISYGSDQVGRPGCTAEVQKNTTQIVDDSLPQKARWSRVSCEFFNILGWNKTGKTSTFPGQLGSQHILSDNPGDYEVKILWKNHLARSIKFTVGEDGKFDNDIATRNKLGSDRVIVPVRIIGDEDGKWDRNAWKTEAFYGNPLQDFTALP